MWMKEEKLTFKVVHWKQALEQYQGVTVYMDRDSISCKYPGYKLSPESESKMQQHSERPCL